MPPQMETIRPVALDFLPNALVARLSRNAEAATLLPLPIPMVAKGGLAPWQSKRVLSYIEDHLDERLRIDDLAALSRLSISYFSVAFRQSFGISVHAFIVCSRIDRATTMMVSTAEQLSRIAIACGFCDQAHLSRQFRRMIGNTPTKWRRMHRPGQSRQADFASLD
jgi:AraC family transcriptional regulator